MDLNYLRRLIKIFDDSSAAELCIVEEGLKLQISKQKDNGTSQYPQIPYIQMPYYQQAMPNQPNALQEQPQQVVQTQNKVLEQKSETHVVAEKPKDELVENYHKIHSPIVGTFYMAPSPDSDPFVEVGSHVTPGTTLCIVEAMKLMNEIESDISGTVMKMLVENAQPVEYNQALFLIKPD